MASIFKRGGVWYSNIRIQGQRLRKPLSTDRRIAEEKLGELVKMRNAHRHAHAPVNMRWQDFRKRYLEQSRAEKKPNTWQGEERAFNQLEKVAPIYRLAQLTPELLDTVKARWVKAKRGKYVINRDLRSIRTAIHKAEAWGYVPRQDWSTNTYLKTPRGRLHFFTVEDMRKLLKVCRGLWRTILFLGFYAGLRREEIHTLRWQTIDFARNRIHIEPTDEWSPKDNERRFIPMARDLRAYLEKLAKTACGPYVVAEGGERPALATMSVYFKRLVRKAGLKGSIHTLRHSFGSHLASSGAPPKAIQEMMGHSKLETTEIYMHLAPGTKEAAVDHLPGL